MAQISHFCCRRLLKIENFFNKILLQLKLLQVVGFTGAGGTQSGEFINNVVKSGKMWFKIQYI